MKEIIIAVISGIIIVLFGWFVAGGRSLWDRHKVYQWLKANTKNKPGETHVDIIEIATGTGITEDRVRNACIAKKLFCYSNSGKEKWSMWHKEPQSVYDGLTKEEIMERISF